jgi:hypothetical protein
MHTNTTTCAWMHFDVDDSTESHNETRVLQQQPVVDTATVKVSACRISFKRPLAQSPEQVIDIALVILCAPVDVVAWSTEG